MKAIELINVSMQSQGDMIHFLEINSYTGEIPRSVQDIRFLLLNLALAELEKPEPTSDAVKILCKRYGTSLAKIATDLEVENEQLKDKIENLERAIREQKVH